MKLALGMMVHRDMHWLRLHLPAYARCVDGIVTVSDDWSDGTDEFITRDYGGTTYWHPFNNNWSEMYNHVLGHAEQEGYDAILRMDPDEAIFDYDVETVRELLKQYALLCFARYNFWGDRLHYTPGIYPDWQARAWLLDKGIRLAEQHHEGIYWPQYGLFEGDPIADTPRQVLRVPHIHIYHYGNVGRERILERDLHYLNVDREKDGLPPLLDRPTDRAFPTRHSIPFHGPQPINPTDVGEFAPYSE